MTRAATVIGGVAACAALSACNALLGTPEPTMRGSDAGSDVAVEPSPDAASDADAAIDPSDAPRASSEAGEAGEAGDPSASQCGGADLANDRDNCGACGHSCQGATCSAGECEPYMLAGSTVAYRGLKSMYGVAVIGDVLYGTDWYQPFALLWATSTHASVTAPVALDVPVGGAAVAGDAMATDGATLIFSTFRTEAGGPAGIWLFDPEGGGKRAIADTAAVSYVAGDAARWYWADESGSIFFADKDGANVGSAECSRDYMTPIAAANGRLYYVGASHLVAADPAKLGGVVGTYSLGTHVDRFAVDATHAYWVDIAGHHLWRAPLVDRAKPEEITTPSLPWGGKTALILVDDEAVYVALGDVYTHMTIVRVRKDGSGSDVMADAHDGIGSWTQDAKTIYFATYGNDSSGNPPYSAIWKIAK